VSSIFFVARLFSQHIGHDNVSPAVIIYIGNVSSIESDFDTQNIHCLYP
jgi:hypothetical protein